MKDKKILQILIILFGIFAIQGASYSAWNLLTPANNANCIAEDATFIWNSQPDAIKYSFKISTSSSFHVDSTVIVNNLTDTTITPFVFQGTNLNSNTNYYWQVVATLINSQILNSSVFTFHTLVHPVTLVQPINDICCLDLRNTFKVQTEYSKVDTLRIIIAADQEMEDVIIDTMVINPVITGGVMSKVLTMPFFATDYYWVAYQSSKGCWSGMAPEAAQHFCTRYGATTLTTPANGMIGIPYFENGIPFNVRLNWKPLTGALNYVIQLSNTSDFASVTEYWSADTTEVITLPNDFNKRYYWRVFSKTAPITLNGEVLDTCNSVTSSAFNFLTPIQPVSLDLPANGSSCVPIITNVTWDAVTSAQFYQIQVSKSLDFHKDSIVIDVDSINTNSTTLNLPIGIMKYHWRVRVNNPGNIGLWSEIRNFEATTETPKEIYPKSGSTGIPRAITLKWDLGKAGSSYRLQISESLDFDENLVDTLLTKNEFPYLFAKYNSKYYWKVMSIYGVCQGAWSNVFNFKTYINVPTLLNPHNDTTMVEPLLVVFEWKGAQGTATYDIDLSADSNFTDLYRFERDIEGTFVIYDNLKENSKYWWRVRGRNAEGTSEWSNVFKLRTGYIRPDVPKLIAPSNDAYKLPIEEINLEWAQAFRASTYRLQVSSDMNFTTNLIDTDSLVNITFKITGLENNKSYYWRVAGKNVQGYSAFSNAWVFRTIPLAPEDTVILTEPTNGAKNLVNKMQVLKWETIPNIDTYELWIAFDNEFTDIYYKNDLVWTNSKTFFNLVPMKTYFWKVRGTNDGGAGPWSETWKFETEDPASVTFNNLFETEITPSPVMNSAKVNITLNEVSDVKFEIMDLNGNIILRREFSKMNEGRNEFELNASLLSSGTYIYRISAESKVEFGKFVVSK